MSTKTFCFMMVGVAGLAGLVAYRLYLHNTHLVTTYNALRLQPLGRIDPTPDPQSLDLILLGDSHVEKWPRDAFPDLSVVQWGQGAQTSQQCLLRIRLMGDAVPSAKAALICVGTNDVQCLGSFPDQQDDILEKTLHNIRDLAQQLDVPHVIVMTVPPLDRYRASYHALDYPAILAGRTEFNRRLRGLAGPQWTILDAATLITDEMIGPDGIHLNAKGYTVLTRALRELAETPSE